MNERIKQLAEKARLYADKQYSWPFAKDDSKWFEFYNNKFAELLVQECVGTTKRVGILEDIENETDMVANAIKEKFGL